MEVNDQLVDNLAHLARLSFKPEEKAGIKEDLQKMISFIEKLNELDTTGVEPLLFMTANENVLRDDEVKGSVSREEGLLNAPLHDGKFFKVPKVIKSNSFIPYSLMNSIIKLINIQKSYFMGNQAIPVLKGLNLDIFKNEYVALMGPSGSGKSTLMNILGCLDSPTAGQYILNEKDVSKLSDNELAEVRNKNIGFVFQQFNLLPRLSAAENVALPLVYAGVSKKQRIERAKEVLDKVGLGDRSHHKPNELSGGQIQRVAIARALVNNPAIILADEPTGNLDSKTSREVMEIFGQIQASGNTVILVTHEEDIASYARRIVRLRDGVIESDTRKDPTPGVRSAYSIDT